MPSRTLKVVLGLVVLAVLGVVAFLILPRDRRDWAEIKVESVSASQKGEITIELKTRYSSRAGIQSKHYVDGVGHGGGSGRGGGLPFLPPKWGSETMMFGINPERVEITGEFTNSPLFARLLVHQGETRRIYAGETLSLYDFTSGGHHFSCVYSVIPAGR